MGAPSFAPGTLLMASLLTVLTSAQGLLTAASKSGGGYAYDFSTVPFLAELAKLGISWALLARARRTDPGSVRITRDARHVALFIVPSIIYMFHNNVQARAAQGPGPAGCRQGQRRTAAAVGSPWCHTSPLISMRQRLCTLGGHQSSACPHSLWPRTHARLQPPTPGSNPLQHPVTSPHLRAPPPPGSSSSSSTSTPPPTRSWAT